MIRLEDLSVVFAAGSPDENRAIRDISLRVESGDFVTIIGSNGAGKTTLYNAIAGTVPVTGGRIFVRADTLPADGGQDASAGAVPATDGLPASGVSARGAPATGVSAGSGLSASGGEREITREAEYRRARYIGRIFQNPLLGTAGKMSLEDNMVLCRRKGYKGLRISLNRALREEFRDRLRVLGMGLENRLADNVELFSGGQRQALTLLMAVLSRPGLLLLDEHTAALDPHNAELVMDLTVRFAAEYRLTVMMITHNMSHALRYGNRLLIMDSGEIIQDIGAAEKGRLTVQGIVERFRDIRKRELASDALLLE